MTKHFQPYEQYILQRRFQLESIFIHILRFIAQRLPKHVAKTRMQTVKDKCNKNAGKQDSYFKNETAQEIHL